MSTNKRLIGLVIFLAGVLGGLLVAVALIGGGPGTSSTATPSPTALASPSATAGATETPSLPPSASPSSSSSSSPSVSASPVVSPGTPASITITQLKLDASEDPAGLDRVVTFQSQGSGVITAKYTSLSPMGTTEACLIAGSRTLGCRSAAYGTLSATTTDPTADFKVTLRGVGIFAPTVEITITFPAAAPTVTITNARFDGTAFPDTNGIRAVVTPRADGAVHLVAQWGGHPFMYQIDLIEQGGPGSQTVASQGTSTNVDTTLPISGTDPWKLVLQNTQTGFGVTGLTASISWP
jgi:hypothetical protein